MGTSLRTPQLAATVMLDVTKIHEAIDAFIMTNPPEDYRVTVNKDDRQRPYLGLSGLGENCIRKVWYQWRHCFKPVFPPRMHRLFRRGDREEFVFVWMLRGIGFTLFEFDENGKQFSVEDFEGHLKGNLDGVGKAPKKFWKKGTKPVPFLTEYKTANAKKFEEFRKYGVKKTNPKYYGQIQGYCGHMDLAGALFCVVCKDDDELYFEWVPAKPREFAALQEKAEEIITAQSPPERRQFASPSYWDFKKSDGCKYCDALGLCFKGASSQKICRTCVYASPGPDKSWICAKGNEYGTVCKSYKDIAKV